MNYSIGGQTDMAQIAQKQLDSMNNINRAQAIYREGEKPSIGSAITTLFSELNELDDAFTALADRLGPVLAPDNQKASGSDGPGIAPDNGTCAVRHQVQLATERLMGLRRRIQAIYSMVEL